MSKQNKIPNEYKGRAIITEYWKPDHPEFEYTQEFIDLIDSINKGWQYKKTYSKFELYKEQSRQWLMDESDICDYESEADQEEWLRIEIKRCMDNSLYFCNKYGKIKEDKADDGSLDYEAWEAQELLLFLLDSGYSFLIGKARQIGFTTTMCLAGMKRVNFIRSYYVKFITHTTDKGIEIFRDKVKWTYNKIPDHIAKEVKNWTDLVMSFEAKSKKKGRGDMSGQRFDVVAPSITAINGGSPALVMVDEVGLMDIFGEMMQEARPALFKFNPETGKMTMQQQFVGWGTSGDMDKGGAAFEALFLYYLDEWKGRRFESGIIPIFFNAFARRGVTQEFLDREKREAESKKGTPKGERLLVQYYQAYPITIDDMFIRKSKTLVDRTYIDKRLKEINKDIDSIEFGRFEPIYDLNDPTPDLFTPFRIKGARWIKLHEGAATATAVVVHHPPFGEKWKYRWWQGTDPINSETGYSKMSSAIWDGLLNTVSSVVFDRQRNFKETYLQCLLQALYYDQIGIDGVQELIENNIGEMYEDFQKNLGFKRKVVPTSALPDYLQSGNKWFGISNRTDTAPKIITKIEELIEAHGDKINIPWFWNQLKTFVEKDLKGTANLNRQTRYQAADTRVDRDDAIFSIAFAYINYYSHMRKTPENISAMDLDSKLRRRFICNRETGFRKILCEVDSRGKIIRQVSGVV